MESALRQLRPCSKAILFDSEIEFFDGELDSHFAEIEKSEPNEELQSLFLDLLFTGAGCDVALSQFFAAYESLTNSDWTIVLSEIKNSVGKIVHPQISEKFLEILLVHRWDSRYDHNREAYSSVLDALLSTAKFETESSLSLIGLSKEWRSEKVEETNYISPSVAGYVSQPEPFFFRRFFRIVLTNF